MTEKAKEKEKATPLGDRVYPKHRKMLKDISKKLGLRGVAAVRFAIEDTHARLTRSSAPQ